MTEFDADLISIQQARDLAQAAQAAQKKWAHATQEEVDRTCAAMAAAGEAAAERLGILANQETGYGVPAHKTLKNLLCSRILWEEIKEVKTVGVIKRDEKRGLVQIAWPMGVVAALIPSTNPTSTAYFKIMIAVKARNAIVIAPHPLAVQCTAEATRVMAEAAERAGAPKGLISCMTHISLDGTNALLKHRAVSLILATGGTPMVRAAHSVGKPAYGVGPGNVPCYIDRSADLAQAARYLVASKSFDFSVICATEQAAIVDKPVSAEFARLMAAEGAYFTTDAETEALRHALFFEDGSINATSVGKSPQVLAQMAGFTAPPQARILVVRLQKVGKSEPLSREKLTTVLGYYEANGWEEGCERCLELIAFGGAGHSIAIHARDERVILAFGLEKPVHRIVVNTLSSLGGVGLTTGVPISMTLGPGGVGGAITGDNISVQHMFTVKNLAYQIHEPPEAALKSVAAPGGLTSPVGGSPAGPSQEALIEQIVQRVLADLGKK